MVYYAAKREKEDKHMAAVIKKFLIVLNDSLHVPPEMFSICGGSRRYTPPEFSYPTCQDAWAQDWNNIGMDFRRAANRLEAEVAR